MAINREKLLGEAQKLIEKRKYDKAIVELKKLTTVDPNDVRTLHKIADVYVKQLAWVEAIDTYDQVAKLYASGGFAPKAIAVYKQMREIMASQVPQLDERYGHIVPRLAALYQESNLNSEALALYEQSGKKLQAQGRLAEAAEVFAQAAHIDSQNPMAWLRVAEARIHSRDLDGAVEAWKMTGDLLLQQERPNDAIQIFERLLQHKHDLEVAKRCAIAYLTRNRPGDAALGLQKLLPCYQAMPQDLEVLTLIARAFDGIGEVQKAFEVRKQAAHVARSSGQMEVFRDLVTYLLRVAPNDPVVRALAGQA